jgi:hypothetical protein
LQNHCGVGRQFTNAVQAGNLSPNFARRYGPWSLSPAAKGLLENSMRMPILSYFIVAGIVIFGGLILVSSQLESKPLPVSQRIGVPPPFKAPPDETQSPTSGVDSAAESDVRD